MGSNATNVGSDATKKECNRRGSRQLRTQKHNEMKIKHLLATAIALCVAGVGNLPLQALQPAVAIAKKKNFKKRVMHPAVDHVNTLGASIERVYMERTFCMINFLLPAGEAPSGASADFYIEVPATGRMYKTRAVGKSHLQARRLLDDGRLYLGVAFEGLPEETQLINVHLPATATHFTGVHLTADGTTPAPAATLEVQPVTGWKPGNKEQNGTSTNKKTVFRSPDLSLYDLVGPVRSCTIHGEGGGGDLVVEFDRQGMVTTFNGTPYEEVFEVKRDGRGFIIELTYRDTDGDDGVSYYYSWTPGGSVLRSGWSTPEGESSRVYTYDRFGAVQSTRESGFQGEEVDETRTYEYIHIDSRERPNWTERRVTATSKTDGRREWTERRTITYYE